MDLQNNPNWKELEEQIRTRPLQSALIAFLVGFVLSLGPIRILLSLAIRLILFALKPALLILGGVKAYEYFRERSAGADQKHP
jgi:hypothetical protein